MEGGVLWLNRLKQLPNRKIKSHLPKFSHSWTENRWSREWRSKWSIAKKWNQTTNSRQINCLYWTRTFMVPRPLTPRARDHKSSSFNISLVYLPWIYSYYFIGWNKLTLFHSMVLIDDWWCGGYCFVIVPTHKVAKEANQRKWRGFFVFRGRKVMDRRVGGRGGHCEKNWIKLQIQGK